MLNSEYGMRKEFVKNVTFFTEDVSKNGIYFTESAPPLINQKQHFTERFFSHKIKGFILKQGTNNVKPQQTKKFDKTSKTQRDLLISFEIK